MAKLKQFQYTKYYRGIELDILCVTSSQKKFAELIGTSINSIKNYALSYEPRNQECIDEPDRLFAKIGMGGEGRHVFDREQILSYEDYKELIDKHREIYSNYRDYLKKTGKE